MLYARSSHMITMKLSFTATYAISAYHHKRCRLESRSGEAYSKHYVIKFVSDLRQVGDFHRVLRLSPPLRLSSTI
jgi:hypothetical protein